mmetsp:Transcript_48349/g.105212  ORF Transcript_48349/g.105212 Transcript_48349/m.105212 type:complete len:214 (+) Transcript_48349:337-978(+)
MGSLQRFSRACHLGLSCGSPRVGGLELTAGALCNLEPLSQLFGLCLLRFSLLQGRRNLLSGLRLLLCEKLCPGGCLRKLFLRLLQLGFCCLNARHCLASLGRSLFQCLQLLRQPSRLRLRSLSSYLLSLQLLHCLRGPVLAVWLCHALQGLLRLSEFLVQRLHLGVTLVLHLLESLSRPVLQALLLCCSPLPLLLQGRLQLLILLEQGLCIRL